MGSSMREVRRRITAQRLFQDGLRRQPARTAAPDLAPGAVLLGDRKPFPAADQAGYRLAAAAFVAPAIAAGKEGQEHKIVISRFPADFGILADESDRALTVEFLERVFMKRATTYKAAAYQDRSLYAGFWLGRAVDKQINSDMVQLSNYWIAEFLDSDFRTTAAAGTKRLAVALRDAARKSSDVTVKTEIAVAVTLGQSLNGQRLTINEFSNRFGLSAAAKQAVASEIRNPVLLDERFQFDVSEFAKQVPCRSSLRPMQRSLRMLSIRRSLTRARVRSGCPRRVR